MLISIIIPCYNAERTIAATIDSALAQEVETEVIVINDGSTDGSRGVITSYGSRVRAEHGPNRGVSAARDRGSALAQGAFLQFVDSDDQLAPGTLLRRVEALRAAGADAAYTDYQKLIETPEHSFVSGEVVVPPAELLNQDAEAACADSRFWVPPVAIMYRREIVDRIGGWKTNLPVIQDARFLFDAAAQGGKFVHVPGIGAYYRVSSASLSRQNRAKFLHDCFVNAEEIERRWRGLGLTPARAAALQSMWRHTAIAALIDGLPEFEPARRSYNVAARREWPIEAGWLLRRALGARMAGVIARSRLQRHAPAAHR